MEADPAANGPGTDGSGGVRDGRFGVEDLVQPLGARRGRGQCEAELAEVADRWVEVADEGGEGEQLAQGHAVGRDLPDAETDDGEHTEGLDDLDELLVPLAQPRAADRGLHPGPCLTVEAPGLVTLAVVGLGEDDVAEGLLDHRGDRPVRGPLVPGGLLDTAGEAAGGEEEERGEDEGDEGQVPAEPERGGRVEDGGEGCGDGAHDTGHDHLLDGLHIPGHPLDQIALAVLLEEVRRETLDMTEDTGPQPQDEPLGSPGGQRVTEVADERAEHGHRQPGPAGPRRRRATRSPGPCR